MNRGLLRAGVAAVLVTACATACSDWRGANSLDLPGAAGHGEGAFTVQAQLPDVENIERNSRVRVGDVTVGSITKIERQGWHALVTMTINGGVKLPANATATIGQTSLLGSLHVELAPPKDVTPEGSLRDGSLIPLASDGAYPATEQTLAAVSLLLNGGGIGQIQEITNVLSTALAGRENDLRDLIKQLDGFVTYLNAQSDDIVAAADGLNRLVSQFAQQKPVIDRALKTVPEALTVLKNQRNQLADALTTLGQFSALADESVSQSKASLVAILKDVGPVLQSLADAGPALTRSLDFFSTFPFPKPTLSKWLRGDYANMTAIIDLTLSRLDAGLLTGTRFEGELTELELQWGRTIGQMPSPYTARNPLVVPYHFNQGP